ncbi:MAG: hypothetical protein CL613_02645 [Aquimarina sp.]|nr:hypothetical protein [Aquimarina sp.]
MTGFEDVIKSLQEFKRKYYINELIKGVILFLAVGALYFIIISVVENFLWLNKKGRLVLFWFFIGVEILLFLRFVVFPILKMLRLRKGISMENASKIIGNHFPDVDDKLLNLLQLNNTPDKSALLLASIEQKSNEIKPVPFAKAVNYTQNKKYLKYLVIPFSIIIFLVLINRINWISDGYNRIVNYNVAYEPPAPFRFVILNDSLSVYENKDYVLRVKTEGEVVPENINIEFDDQIYLMKNRGDGTYEYTFSQVKESLGFQLSGNDVSLQGNTLEVIEVPSLLDFNMELDYPSYTGRRDETLKSTGNAVIPEGTKVTWRVRAKNTKEVNITLEDSVYSFTGNEEGFELSKGMYRNVDYRLSTSNDRVKNYDNLSFAINVVKDQYPEISVRSERDTLDTEIIYHSGRVSDDYGLTNLRLVYYKNGEEDKRKLINLGVRKSTLDEFIYVFPDTLSLEEGTNYKYYFEIFDNDVLHKYKSSKSQIYEFRKLTTEEKENKTLQTQKEAISELDKSLEKLEDSDKSLEELSKMQKEKREMNFQDRQKLKDFLKRQEAQEKMMQDFTKQLKESLQKNEKEEPFKDALREKLERNEERLKKNEELLKELQELSDKLQKEELGEKLEELGKENKNIKRNLEQLVELTKRFYVSEKAQKVSDQLQKLGDKQENIAKDSEKKSDEQSEIEKSYEDIKKELDQLKKENNELRKPMDILPSEADKEEISNELKDAQEKIQNEDEDGATKSQKSAGQKMKQMAESMGQQMQASGMEQQMEDMEMLRQVLDNLVDFSLGQEDLMDGFKSINFDNPSYSGKLKQQSVLRENFIHIDDSLYALALRTPKITDLVTEKLTDIEFNIEKSLERLAENRVIQGTANQQYIVTGANDLAYLLSSILDQMQNSMSSSGKGKGGKNEFQLPDIIKGQEQLEGEMKDGMKPNKGEGKEKPNGEEKGSEGNKGQEDGEGEKGKGKEGKDGDKGKGDNGASDNYEGSEKENEAIFEIFKQQQKLRNELEQRIKREGLDNKLGSEILKEMEQVEQELLERGINEGTLARMVNLKHKLLKLEDATLKQGEEERRVSNTNNKDFDIEYQRRIERAKDYFNSTEILNRQVLPLRKNYKDKVKEYFKDDN